MSIEHHYSSRLGARHTNSSRMGVCARIAGLIAGLTLAFGPTPVAQADDAVTLCRVDALEPAREQTVRVSEVEAAALLAVTPAYSGPCADYGQSANLGNGRITAYSQTDSAGTPLVIGLAATDSVYDALPYDPPSSGLYCYDKNADGTVDPHHECAGGHEHALPLPENLARRDDMPFTYVLANWNPHGHVPAGVWDTAHFDVHFYLNDNAERLAIRPGPCLQMTACADYALGKNLPAAKYRPPSYADLDAIEPAMGQHLINTTTPELNGGPFTHTFIYGSWNGEITFYEPMVNLDQYNGLRSGAIGDACTPIEQPRAWQQAGWYPTRYCLRHRANRSETLTTLEEFVYREAS
ncbi:hypothetical protein BJY24_006236 [Nocardia transvalensis]|uniref:Uncharacterized protein n=1 Tax=Nocardia transvalensis TaxID=37333 RepID=A0A7W9PKK2_9NOCA|nr:hypothetical protein [Nocardia transvalensis]MBB5917324.1 hypothetical protein [Nocardia transvalensis]